MEASTDLHDRRLVIGDQIDAVVWIIEMLPYSLSHIVACSRSRDEP